MSGWSEQPRTLAVLVALYTVVTLAAQARYGVERWSARGEAFSVYFNLLSRIAPFETRDRVVGVRPLLGGLPRLTIVPGTIAFVAVMIGTVTFDGLSQGSVWSSVRAPLEDAGTAIGLSLENAEKVAAHGRACRLRRVGGGLLRARQPLCAQPRAGRCRPSGCGAGSCTRSCRSRSSTSRRTT